MCNQTTDPSGGGRAAAGDVDGMKQAAKSEEEMERERPGVLHSQESQQDDQFIAEQLQQHEDNISKKADPCVELKNMAASSYGKGILFVQEVIALVGNAKKEYPILEEYNVDTVSQDDMVFLARQMLDLKDYYKSNNLPSLIDLGYHYTNEANMKHIRANGLLTKGDRKSKKVEPSVNHGSQFGDGVYTANCPSAFKKYGNVGLIVARLQGKAVKVKRCLLSEQYQKVADANTVVGDKMVSGFAVDVDGWPIQNTKNEVVLKTSSQVLPMIRYDRGLVEIGQKGPVCINSLALELGILVDKFMNDEAEAVVTNDKPPLGDNLSNTAQPTAAQTKTAAQTLANPISQITNTSSSFSFGATVKSQQAFTPAKPVFQFQPAGHPSVPPNSNEANKTLSSNQKDYKSMLIQYYHKYNPLKLHSVDFILQKYSGNESLLFKNLARKYNTSNPLMDAGLLSHGTDPIPTIGNAARVKPYHHDDTRPAGPFGSHSGLAPFSSQGVAASQPASQNITSAPFHPTFKQDDSTKITSHSITAMEQYEMKSFEELRLEDYMAGNNGYYYSFTSTPFYPTFKQEESTKITLHSITAMPQYEMKSFEELRLEAYLAGKAKSLAGIEGKQPVQPSSSYAIKSTAGTPHSAGFGFGQRAERSACTSAQHDTSKIVSFGPASNNTGEAKHGPTNTFSSAPTPSKPAPFSFGSNMGDAQQGSTDAFSFGRTASKPSGFSFGNNRGDAKHGSTNVFSSAPTPNKPLGFSFGSNAGEAQRGFTSAFASAPTSSKPSGFSFGSNTGEVQRGFASAFASAPTSSQPAPFSFGSNTGEAKHGPTNAFSFGHTPSKLAPFSFGSNTGEVQRGFASAFASAPTPSKPAPFSSFGSNTGDAKHGPTNTFSFGHTPSKPAPFSFGSNAGEAKHGPINTFASAPTSSQSAPFSFGSTVEAKQGSTNAFSFGRTASKPSGFSFGSNIGDSQQGSTNTNAFSFGHNPSKSSGFGFGSNAGPAQTTPLDIDRSIVLTKTHCYVAPSALHTILNPNALRKPNPRCIDLSEECAICFEILSSSECAQIVACSHTFHEDCINQSLTMLSSCPVCRKSIGEPMGLSPSGAMEVFTDDGHCDGFEDTNTIVIKYNIPSGIQKSYHVNSGQRHQGKYTVAYLPNNANGRSLLKRLKYAFMHGLTFSIGTSLTTNAENQCTWSSVHHKTKRSGGAHVHGFPDPNYFENCNSELDGLNVPAANLLDEDGSS